MKRIEFRIFIVLFSGILSTGLIHAQTNKLITLKACIDSALANYPSIKSFEKIEKSKAVFTKGLQNQILPELEFAFQPEYNVYKNYEYRILDNQLRIIWDMGKWTGKLEQLGITGEKIAEYKTLRNKLELIYRVKHAYYALITAKKNLKIAKLSEYFLKHLLFVNEKLYRAGQIKQLDLYFTQTELSRAKEKVLTAQSEIEVLKIHITNLTGYDFSLTDSLKIPEELIFSKNYSLDLLLEKVRCFNPAILILEKQVELANIRANLIQNRSMPKLVLGGGYVFDNDPTSGGNYSKISGGLLLPVFDWGRRRNMVQSLRLKAEAMESTKQTLLIEINSKLMALVNRFNIVKKLLGLKETSIKQAQNTYDLTLINYQEGISTNTDVLLAQKALIESKTSKEKLIYSLYEIESQIENLVGKPEVNE